MTPSCSSQPVAVRGGFTLIELLVVIAIIAVLVTGAFGAFYFAIDKTRRLDAQVMARAVADAVDEFEKETDRMPEPLSAVKLTDCDSDTSAEEGLMNILLGLDRTQNSRGTNYLTDMKEATMSGKNKRVGGIVRNGDTAELLDPWGHVYKVTLDLDLDGKIKNPDESESQSDIKEIHKRVILYSAGRDGDLGTWKDNVRSWPAN